MRKSQFRACVERLEQRAVLGTVHAGAVPGQGVPLLARGEGAMIGQFGIPDGSYQTIHVLKGKARSFGSFTGQLVLNYGTNQYQVKSGSAVINASGGEVLLPDVSGSFRIPRVGAHINSGTLDFTIRGGTGTFANATGSGQIFVRENLETSNLKYTIHGSVRTQ